MRRTVQRPKRCCTARSRWRFHPTAPRTPRLTQNAIPEELRGRLTNPVEAQHGDEVAQCATAEADASLVGHLQEMLEMRGAELGESKRRLQSYKEKMRELQQKLTEGEVELAAAEQENQGRIEAQVELESRLATLTEELSESQDALAKSKERLEKETEEKRGLELVVKRLRAELEETKTLAVSQATAAESSQSHIHVYDTNEHVEYLEDQLVQAKIGWAQAEEDKDAAEFKAKELKQALAKGREINMQFAKRMTKLEVKLNKEKEKRGGLWGGGGRES